MSGHHRIHRRLGIEELEARIAPAWLEIGLGSAAAGGISDTGTAYSGSAVVGADGNPIVAWQDYDSSGGDTDIYVRRWDGSSWVEMGTGSAQWGGISNNSTPSYDPSIAVDSTGNPIVAWQDSDGSSDQIYARRWDGSSWVEMNGSASGTGMSNTSTDSSSVSLTTSSTGQTYAAWQDSDGVDDQIFLKRWDGSSWVDMSGSPGYDNISNNSADSNAPSITTDAGGNPIVAWSDYGAGSQSEIYLRRWNGCWWQELNGSASGTGISNTSGGSYTPSVATDGSGNPIVAWSDHMGSGDAIYARRWDGSSWVEMNGSGSSGGLSNTSSAYSPTVATDASGNPVVAWNDYGPTGGSNIFARRWDGSSWVEIGSNSASGGGLSNTLSYSSHPMMTTGANGSPLVAWYDGPSGNTNIYIRQWDSSPWGELGNGSARYGGISNTSTPSNTPSVATDSSGNPIVAWQDNDGSDDEIYLRRWDGSSWVDMSGSAGNENVSNNSTGSDAPTVAVGTDGNPIVAWQDDQPGNDDIFLRRWDGSSWVDMSGSGSYDNISNNGSSPSTNASVTVGANGPIVAWQQGTGSDDIYLSRWNGACGIWTNMSGSGPWDVLSSGSSQATTPSVTVDATGNPIVAWSDDEYGAADVYLRRWDGSSWVSMSGSPGRDNISNTSGTSSTSASVTTDAHGNPVVAWDEDNDIYLRRWDGSSWVDMSGSGSYDNVSNTSSGSNTPSIATDVGGNPIVAWQDSDGSDDQIFARRWDGSSWVEVPTGSASGSGVSANNANSVAPAVVIGPGGAPVVAWADGGTDNIYVRKHDVTPPLVMSATNSTYNFIDSDGDLIYLNYGGPGEAWIATAGGQAPTNGTDIASINFSGTTAGTTFTIRDANGGANTMTAGAVTTAGPDNIGMLQFLNGAGPISNTDVTVGGTLNYFAGYGTAFNGTLTAGSVGSAYYYTTGGVIGDLTTTSGGVNMLNTFYAPMQGNVTTAGNLGAFIGYAGVAPGSTFSINGDVPTFCSYGPMGGTFNATGRVTTFFGLGNVTGDFTAQNGVNYFYSGGNLDGAFTVNTGGAGTVVVNGNVSNDVAIGGGVNTLNVTGGRITGGGVTILGNANSIVVSGYGGPAPNVIEADIAVMAGTLGYFSVSGGDFNGGLLADAIGTANYYTPHGIMGGVATMGLVTDGHLNYLNVPYGGLQGSATVDVAGHAGNLMFYKGLQGNLAVGTGMTHGGVDYLYVAGGAVTGTVTVHTGNVTTMQLNGGSGPAVNGGTVDIQNGGIGSAIIQGGMAGSAVVQASGNANLVQIYGGMSGGSTLNVQGTTNMAYLYGATGGPCVDGTSQVTFGTLGQTLSMSGPLAGNVTVTGSAAGSNTYLYGNFQGSATLLAGTFGNVLVLGRFEGQIGDGTATAGSGNRLYVTQPGGTGNVNPANAFQYYYGCTP